jgi:cinnamyl-alcohol dehydrogenase
MPSSVPTNGLAAYDPKKPLAFYSFDSPTLKDDSKAVALRVLYCGICHSDIHTVRFEWGPQPMPLCPGHEIAGVVTEVGSAVTKFKVGDKVGVGCMVGSCRDVDNCKACAADEEEFCSGMILTYGTSSVEEKQWASACDPTVYTQGGYTSHMVVPEHFVLRWPESLDMERGAPLLCAGITVYTPLQHFGLNKPGMKVAVNGMGGLGHMAIKIAAAMGCEVTVLSRSEHKRADAMALGATSFVISSDEAAMKAASGTLDGIIDSVSAHHEVAPLIDLLKFDGKLVFVGAPPTAYSIEPSALIFKRVTVAGSLIGGIKRTQEMLDFCAEKGILPETETVACSYVNEAYERVLKSDVKYRFVLDIGNTLDAAKEALPPPKE